MEPTRRVVLKSLSGLLPCMIGIIACEHAQQAQTRPPEGQAAHVRTGKTEFLVDFLSHADLQIETAAQRTELMKALNDMATLPPEELAKRRYADYQGNAGKWTLLRILRA